VRAQERNHLLTAERLGGEGRPLRRRVHCLRRQPVRRPRRRRISSACSVVIEVPTDVCCKDSSYKLTDCAMRTPWVQVVGSVHLLCLGFRWSGQSTCCALPVLRTQVY
jgi:hypothetical protein